MKTAVAAPFPEGSEVVETDELLLTEKALGDIVTKSRMGAFVGTSGTGKTFSVRRIASEMENLDVVWLEFQSRPSIVHLSRVIYEGLFDEPAKGSRNKLSSQIIDGLRADQRDRPLLIAVDEAQRLNTECIEYLRYLHDHVGTGFSMAILGGDGAWQVIREEPMLLSRMYRRVTFQPMSNEAALRNIRSYHSMYEDVEDELIMDLNEMCKGVFRHWATVTDTLVDLMAEKELDKLDFETVSLATQLIFERE